MDPTPEPQGQLRRDYVHLVEKGDVPVHEEKFGEESFKYPEKRVGSIGLVTIEASRILDDEDDDLTDKSVLLTKNGLQIVPAAEVGQNFMFGLEVDNPIIGIRNAECNTYISLDGETDLLKSRMIIWQDAAAKTYAALGLDERAEKIRGNRKTQLSSTAWNPVNSSMALDPLIEGGVRLSDPELLRELFFRFEIIQKPGGDVQA